MTAHCKIGRVRMKAGGATVKVLERTADVAEEGNRLIRNARSIALHLGQDIGGFIVLGWSAAGAYSIGYSVHGDGVPPVTLLPSWVADVVRREIVTAQAVRDVIQREYVPPGRSG